jgi:hypothetical protein
MVFEPDQVSAGMGIRILGLHCTILAKRAPLAWLAGFSTKFEEWYHFPYLVLLRLTLRMVFAVWWLGRPLLIGMGRILLASNLHQYYPRYTYPVYVAKCVVRKCIFRVNYKIVWKCYGMYGLGFSKTLIFPHSTPLILQFSKWETHIHDISNTYTCHFHSYLLKESHSNPRNRHASGQKGSTWPTGPQLGHAELINFPNLVQVYTSRV